MSFFQRVFGFEEREYGATQKLLQGMLTTHSKSSYDNREIHSLTVKLPDASTTTIQAGSFFEQNAKQATDAVNELLKRDSIATKLKEVVARQKSSAAGIVKVKNQVGESRGMHSDLEGFRAVYQAASQFNYLEHASPRMTAQEGITCYEFDRTQGPACAIACAAGTAYRNYLAVTPDGKTGQSAESQFNGLCDVETCLKERHLIEPSQKLWRVKNGYIDSSIEKLDRLNELLQQNKGLGDELSTLLKIGVQRDTEVTNEGAGGAWTKDEQGKWNQQATPELKQLGGKLLCTQVYGSAVSVGYSMLPPAKWAPLAQLVLDGLYETTLLIGIANTLMVLDTCENVASFRPPPIYLTKVGGGVFANQPDWIMGAMRRSFEKAQRFNVPLDVRIVHYGSVEDCYRALESEM